MINVELGQSKLYREDVESLFLSFDYDYNTVQKVKTLDKGIRAYNRNDKIWEVKKEGIKQLIEIFGEDNLIIDDNIDKNYEKPELIKTEANWSVFEKLLKVMPSDIMDFTVEALKQTPQYFYDVASSSSGKYHPSYALGKGGLVRHTLASGLIALELFGNTTITGEFTAREKYLMLSAIVLHDTFKLGKEKERYTVTEHPLLASKFIREFEQIHIKKNEVEIIAKCIDTHMGEWNKNSKTGEEVLDKPESDMQKFVHMCDYLASRKLLEVNFNEF